jgi:hypothetical protein
MITQTAIHKTPSRMAQYWSLTKPRVTQLAVFCAVIGMFLATDGFPGWHVLVWGTIGIWLLAGAAFAVNCLIEAEVDARMARTARRATAMGELSTTQVLIFSAIIGGAGMGILYTMINPLTMWLTFVTFVGYALIYTVLLKPNTPQNIVIGGLSGAVLLVQLALGGWVSTNYATLACSDFPLCNGQIVPEMDWQHGFTLWRELGKTAAGHYLPFSALTAIHWVHRNFALVVVLVLGYTAWRTWRLPGLHGTARNLALVLVAQATTGIATVFLNFPLPIAVLHNAGAAGLVLLVTMLNYKVQYQLELALRSPRREAATSASHP